MRYGLQFADSNPFPQDVNFGIQLEDETIVVPEECPECPEAVGCEVACYGVDAYLISASNPPSISALRYINPGTISAAAETAVVLAPAGEWCGHRTRFLVDEGTWVDHTISILSGDDGEKSIGLTWGYSGSGTGTVQFQIDLTDAAPGEETWSAVCPLIEIYVAPPG
jgi:hypothetical protein